jgi:transcriptional regulator with XRE-family HTH domain
VAIRRLREQKFRSRRSLADSTGITSHHLGKVEAGSVNVRWGSLCEIAAAADVSVSWLAFSAEACAGQHQDDLAPLSFASGWCTATPTAEDVGWAIRHARYIAGYNRVELADAADGHFRMIYQLERGKTAPSWGYLCKVAGAVRMDVSELVRRAEVEADARLRRERHATVGV